MSEQEITDLADDKLRDFALAVECHHCETVPGEPCWEEDGRILARVHAERIEHLRTLVREGISFYEVNGGEL